MDLQENNTIAIRKMAKYLFISAKEDNPTLSVDNIPAFLKHILERIDPTRDLHFHTQTTIDTLDYTGNDLNSGSKVVFAAAGSKKRELATEVPIHFPVVRGFENIKLAMEGILAIEAPGFTNYQNEEKVVGEFTNMLKGSNLTKIALIVLCDDAGFTAENINNLVWTTFTKSNPSHDIYGVGSFTSFKHWGCTGPIVIDARKKPHHAPDLIKDSTVERKVDALGALGKSLYGIV